MNAMIAVSEREKCVPHGIDLLARLPACLLFTQQAPQCHSSLQSSEGRHPPSKCINFLLSSRFDQHLMRSHPENFGSPERRLGLMVDHGWFFKNIPGNVKELVYRLAQQQYVWQTEEGLREPFSDGRNRVHHGQHKAAYNALFLEKRSRCGTAGPGGAAIHHHT